jgi:ribosomal protein L29
MLNPLVDSLDDLTITELENKVVELQRKYFMTRNSQVQAQIANILQIYREEAHTRRAIEYERQKNQENGESGLDSLINIS